MKAVGDGIAFGLDRTDTVTCGGEFLISVDGKIVEKKDLANNKKNGVSELSVEKVKEGKTKLMKGTFDFTLNKAKKQFKINDMKI